MTRDYNNPNNNSRNPNRENNRNNRERDPRDNRDRRNRGPRNSHGNNYNSGKKYNKSMIFLKSTVYSLGIILTILIIAFFIVRNNKNFMANYNITNLQCDNQQAIKINGRVDEIAVGKSEIVILSENKQGNQELIKLDKNCLSEISRRQFTK